MIQLAPDIVIIDHLGIIKNTPSYLSDQELGRIERNNKVLAKFFDDMRKLEEKTYRKVIIEKIEKHPVKYKSPFSL